MNDEALEKALSANLARVNDWLKFAEAKNAALLTFTSAWLLAIASLWSNNSAPFPIRCSLLVASQAIVAAAFFSLISLLPRGQRKKNSVSTAATGGSNLLFHGNISKIDLANAYATFSSRYGVQAAGQVSANLMEDLSIQLVETSAITATKFNLFSLGAKCVICAFITGTGTFLGLLITIMLK